MAITPDTFQERLDNVLQETMTYTTLSAIDKTTVRKKRIEVLQDLSQPSSFDNYIDVMQQYIDLAHTILAEGVDKPPAKFAGQDGWSKEIDRLYLHFKGFTNNIMILAGKWMGYDYKKYYDVDFLEPLKSLTVNTRVSYMMAGDDTPEWLVPFFEDLKRRLVIMTENDNISSNQAEKAQKVWAVCKTLQDRAMFLAGRLIRMMEKIVSSDKTVVSINLREIIARANASPSATSGGRRTKRNKKRIGGKKRSGHKRSGKRSDRNK
jgi:hypothetical protein